jgi:enterochelin esterase-like enzyme
VVRNLNEYIVSRELQREVTLTVLLPPGYEESRQNYPLLLFQDGQDFAALRLQETLEYLITNQLVRPVVVVGTHANKDRVQEYGVARQPDYANRGSRAGHYTRFVLQELLPRLEASYRLQGTSRMVAGFSLGGLMALDLALNYPEVFSKVGVFSGALWWRQKAFDINYRDTDRIMHRQIKELPKSPGLKFWFQTGTLDEADDRDGDGVIDSIADTLDCIAELERKGYRWGRDIKYLEVKGGQHNPETWARVMPQFLQWLLGK